MTQWYRKIESFEVKVSKIESSKLLLNTDKNNYIHIVCTHDPQDCTNKLPTHTHGHPLKGSGQYTLNYLSSDIQDDDYILYRANCM